MTENLAERGEGLKGLVAKWRELADSAGSCEDTAFKLHMDVAFEQHRRTRLDLTKCALELEAEIAALEAAARLPASDTECEYCDGLASVCVECYAKALAACALDEAKRWHTNWNVDESIRSFDVWARARIAALATPSPQAPDRDLLLAEIARKWAKSAVEGLVRRNIIGRYLADEADARDGIADSIKGAIHEALSAAVPAATQEQPAGSEAQAEQASAKLKCGCQPIHSTECVFRDVRSSQYRHFYEFEKGGSPRKVGEDGQIVIDCLRDHWPTWIDGEAPVEQIGVCSCGKAKADGVRKYQQIWSEHMGELVRDVLRSSSVPVGEQKQEEGAE